MAEDSSFTMTKSSEISVEHYEGMLWHQHHSPFLVEYGDLQERLAEIREIKPEAEWPLRERLIKPVRGDLPVEFVEAAKRLYEALRAYNEASRAYAEVRRAYNEAARAYNEACRAWDEAGRAWDEAFRAWDEAGRAWDEAFRAYRILYKKHQATIEKLHAKECLNDCPWDGETIFS